MNRWLLTICKALERHLSTAPLVWRMPTIPLRAVFSKSLSPIFRATKNTLSARSSFAWTRFKGKTAWPTSMDWTSLPTSCDPSCASGRRSLRLTSLWRRLMITSFVCLPSHLRRDVQTRSRKPHMPALLRFAPSERRWLISCNAKLLDALSPSSQRNSSRRSSDVKLKRLPRASILCKMYVTLTANLGKCLTYAIGPYPQGQAAQVSEVWSWCAVEPAWRIYDWRQRPKSWEGVQGAGSWECLDVLEAENPMRCCFKLTLLLVHCVVNM